MRTSGADSERGRAGGLGTRTALADGRARHECHRRGLREPVGGHCASRREPSISVTSACTAGSSAPFSCPAWWASSSAAPFRTSGESACRSSAVSSSSAAGLAVAGTAGSMPVLVVGRVVQGFGGGAVPATAYAAIGRAYPSHVRPTMFAILSTAWVVPGLARAGAGRPGGQSLRVAMGVPRAASSGGRRLRLDRAGPRRRPAGPVRR